MLSVPNYVWFDANYILIKVYWHDSCQDREDEDMSK